MNYRLEELTGSRARSLTRRGMLISLALWLWGCTNAAAQPTNTLLLSIQRGSSNTFSILVPSAPGKTNLLEMTDSLLAPLWLPTHAIQGTGEVQAVELSPPPRQPEFFRLAGPRQTSLDLIDEALQRGEITAETALVYRVYVLFQDDRLPPAYRGDDSHLGHFPALNEAAAAFSMLSTNAQNLLQPFFIPPAYVGSWADRYQTNSTNTIAVGPQPRDLPPETRNGCWTNESGPDVVVWYRTCPPCMIDPQAAKQAVADCEYIWPRLHALYGLTPIPDKGQIRDGGDGRLDIYVFDFPTKDATTGNASLTGDSEEVVAGVTVPWTDEGCKGPRWIQIQPRFLNKCVLAHEMSHAFVAAFPLLGDNCAPYFWLDEATAEWVDDYVYPTDNCEHPFARDYLIARDKDNKPRIELPLDTRKPNQLPYDHYIFLFYVAHAAGGTQAVANIWRNGANQEPLTNINSAMPKPDGLDKVWADFAAANWNKPPLNYYAQWDPPLLDSATTRAAHGVKGPSTTDKDLGGEYSLVDLQGQPELVYALDLPVDYMAAVYYRFVFRDPDAHSVAFYNPFGDSRSAPNPHVAVQAVYKVEGQLPQFENWTHILQRNFCRDLKDERIEELIVIVSNSDWQDKNPLPTSKAPLLMANNIGCYKWTGQATSSSVLDFNNTHQEVNNATPITFQLLHPELGTFNNEVFLVYEKVTAPGFEWDSVLKYIGSDPPCTCTWGAANYSSDPSTVGGSMIINNFVVPGASYTVDMLDPTLVDTPRACAGGFSGETTVNVQGAGCMGQCPFAAPWWEYQLPLDPNLTWVQINDDGAIKENATVTQPSETATQSVTFTAVPE